jgi:hypothetical protein
VLSSRIFRIIGGVKERRKNPSEAVLERRSSNRRAFPRWLVPFQVRYGLGKESIEAEGLEIGEAGLSFLSDKSYPLGTELNLQYRLSADGQGDKAWVPLKVVVRHSDGQLLGVEFLNLLRPDRLKIVEYTTATKAQS